MANNYLVTLASEQLYRAAREFLSSLESVHYLPVEAIKAYDKLEEVLDSYHNLAYQSDRVVETKPPEVKYKTCNICNEAHGPIGGVCG